MFSSFYSVIQNLLARRFVTERTAPAHIAVPDSQ